MANVHFTILATFPKKNLIEALFILGAYNATA